MSSSQLQASSSGVRTPISHVPLARMASPAAMMPTPAFRHLILRNLPERNPKDFKYKHQFGELFKDLKIKSIWYDPSWAKCSFNVMWNSLSSKIDVLDLHIPEEKPNGDTKTRTWKQTPIQYRQAIIKDLTKEFPELRHFVGSWVIKHMASSIVTQVRVQQSKRVDHNGNFIHPRRPDQEPKAVSEGMRKKQMRKAIRKEEEDEPKIDEFRQTILESDRESLSFADAVESDSPGPVDDILPSMPTSRFRKQKERVRQEKDTLNMAKRKQTSRVSPTPQLQPQQSENLEELGSEYDDEGCDISDLRCEWPTCTNFRDVPVDSAHKNVWKRLCSSCITVGRTNSQLDRAIVVFIAPEDPVAEPSSLPKKGKAAKPKPAKSPTVRVTSLRPSRKKDPTPRAADKKADDDEKKRKRVDNETSKESRKKAKVSDDAALDRLKGMMGRK